MICLLVPDQLEIGKYLIFDRYTTFLLLIWCLHIQAKHNRLTKLFLRVKVSPKKILKNQLLELMNSNQCASKQSGQDDVIAKTIQGCIT